MKVLFGVIDKRIGCLRYDNDWVTLDYDVHRKISGYYSSKPEFTDGLRVRDWLSGQTFEEQTRFGWDIIKRYRGGNECSI